VEEFPMGGGILGGIFRGRYFPGRGIFHWGKFWRVNTGSQCKYEALK